MRFFVSLAEMSKSMTSSIQLVIDNWYRSEESNRSYGEERLVELKQELCPDVWTEARPRSAPGSCVEKHL